MAQNTMPQWKGLFDWSMQHSDGTRPTDVDAVQKDPEKMKWCDAWASTVPCQVMLTVSCVHMMQLYALACAWKVICCGAVTQRLCIRMCTSFGSPGKGTFKCRLEGVMKTYMVDFDERMQSIQDGLGRSTNADASAREVQEAEALLDELLEIVESIDFARDLHTIGLQPFTASFEVWQHTPQGESLSLQCATRKKLQILELQLAAFSVVTVPDATLRAGGLPKLLELMQCPHASLRSRAADVVATSCQNNQPVQVSCPAALNVPRNTRSATSAPASACWQVQLLHATGVNVLRLKCSQLVAGPCRVVAHAGMVSKGRHHAGGS